MAHQLLSEIHNQSRKWTVSVLVSRLWFYRGGTDSGPIKHMDLVVLDSQGNHMYVQIPPQAAEQLKHELEEGKVYMMSSFNCIEAKTTFRAVESPFMIQFTRFSRAVLRPGLEADYPFCTYNLIPFQDIQKPSGPPARFLDVIGRITAVSDVIPVHSMHQPEPSNTRTIILADLQGQEIKLVLWGDRAVEFEGEAVRARDEKQAVIAIFVGTLPKMNQGVKGLSGSSACRWYIDEDLPVINDFRNRLGTDFKPIDNNGALVEGAFPTRVYADPIEMTVSDLLQLNPYENEEKRFICIVTVERLNPDQRWWFFSCSTCNKTSTMLAASQYRCTNPNCSTKDAQETYCLSLFARDDVAEAEFIMFDKVGKAAVGKPLLTLLKFRNPGLLTIQEIARVPMVDRIAPPEVTQVVGQKYKLLVSISKRSFATTSTQLSFQVVKIMETYKPELSSSAFDCVPGTSGASSSASLIDSPVPSELFTPNTPSIQQAQPGSSSGSLAIGYQTPTGGARTPTSKLNASLLSSASPGKSPCPTGSARRVLFLGDEKKTILPEETKKPTKADEENYDDKAEDPSAAAEGKDDKAQVPKNKRSSVAGKGTAGGKKTKQ